jgi:hypothetical protein
MVCGGGKKVKLLPLILRHEYIDLQISLIFIEDDDTSCPKRKKYLLEASSVFLVCYSSSRLSWR